MQQQSFYKTNRPFDKLRQKRTGSKFDAVDFHGRDIDLRSIAGVVEAVGDGGDDKVGQHVLVGLELEPKMLWSMRARLLGLGGGQVALTAVAVMAVVMLMGQVWTVALTIGLVLALSSTAIVLQTLGEKGLMKSDGGQSSFSVLLFQDIAVIPMLALIPLLAMPELVDAMSHAAHDAEGDHGSTLSLVEGLPGWTVAIGSS